MALAVRPFVAVLLAVAFAGCTADTAPADRHSDKESALVILKPRSRPLTQEERASLGIAPEIISRVETAAGSAALPFYETILSPSANLKGDVLIAHDRLAGFSVQTKRADKLITDLSPSLRSAGCLIFRSEQNFGTIPDIVSVIPGKNSYDIIKMQKTEAPQYNLDTAAIIRWLRSQQQHVSFTITGAGPDWIEAKFVRPPRDMLSFGQKVAAFAPDMLRQDTRTVERLAARMKEMNGFYLWWD
jgi:hypothetical protein